MKNQEWLTVNEQNNARFDIQRSNGATFVDIGTLPGAGTDLGLNSYTFVDEDPELGMNYYRIKQVDLNGAFSYSAVVEVSRTEVNSISFSNIYPNPTNDQIFLDYALPRGVEAEYQIINMAGKGIQAGSLEAGEGIRQFSISLKDFSPGMYVFVMKSSRGKIKSKRFILSR